LAAQRFRYHHVLQSRVSNESSEETNALRFGYSKLPREKTMPVKTFTHCPTRKFLRRNPAISKLALGGSARYRRWGGRGILWVEPSIKQVIEEHWKRCQTDCEGRAAKSVVA
jgi:hypothetical protein